MMVKVVWSIALFSTFVTHATGTSMKIDFLPFADVRTDPIVAPTSLSDHVHTFYGATVARPETTYDDLFKAYGGSGNVEENQSLYWHPTIYKVLPDGTKEMAKMYLASAYYIWETGKATAFPDGFKMIAFVPESQANGWFPQEPTDELETEIPFPNCWDGVNIDSPDHMSHVAYSNNGDIMDVTGPCPPSHPVKLPKIEFFVRVSPYTGGPHIFSDGTTRMHADYFSGWNATFLQEVLDNCSNDSLESAPEGFCENHVTFKDAPKAVDPCGTLESELAKIQAFQPNRLDTSTITDEVINGVVNLPLGEGTGTLKPAVAGPVATLPPVPTPAPTPPVPCNEEGTGDDEDEGDGDGEDDGEEGEEDGGESGGGDGEDGEGDEGGDEDTEDEGEDAGDEECDEDECGEDDPFGDEEDVDEGGDEDGDEEGDEGGDEAEDGDEECDGDECDEDDPFDDEEDADGDGDEEDGGEEPEATMVDDPTRTFPVNARLGQRGCEWLSLRPGW
eukprot:CAMPEP_0116859856 /NCGR_PEP_ID=MMETSP0418-20121206/22073_1 /TAXON_ID=1158023 /ORGANISM="Astrosyne radiata, Strain 13vi08-1A" /LENGTH=502 /DNA_ID=CAMNT_0004494161 /DNA_START=213 /DNA_END=1718 /DNA_ORIENTATION=-